MTETIMKYLVVIEQSEDGSFGAYLPDLPGCIAAGDTREEAEQLIREAVTLHLDSLRENNEPIPEPRASVFDVEAA